LTEVKVRTAPRITFSVVKPHFHVPSLRLSRGVPLTAESIRAIFSTARRLKVDARAGKLGRPLHGKNLALLLGRWPGRETSALHRAALELGAQVAEVRFAEPAGASRRDEIRNLARILGRMYDAVDCGMLAPATVRLIEREAGLPVCEGLGLDDHPARVLADLMTLCDQPPPPSSEASILFVGDPRSMRSRSFLSAARETGFEVHMGEHPQGASNDATFVVDATHAPRWSLYAPTGPLDEAQRSENHRCVMQALLLDAIAKA
jgi:ornithine carbamoyltransferase